MEAGLAWRQTSFDVAYWFICLAEIQVFSVCHADIQGVMCLSYIYKLAEYYQDQMHASRDDITCFSCRWDTELRNAVRCS
jgi:hypothetical protein